MSSIASLVGDTNPGSLLPGAAGSTNPSGVNRLNELSSGEFLKIMLKELTTQDPFEPNDTAQILEQLSSLRNIESQTALKDNLGTLVTQNAVASAGGFIGKFVKGLDATNAIVQGNVTSLRIENSKPILVLDTGATLPASRITDVSEGAGSAGGTAGGHELLQQALASLALLDSSATIGKLATGTGEDGEEVRGVVASIRQDEPGKVVLELDNGRILPIQAVKQLSPVDTAAVAA